MINKDLTAIVSEFLTSFVPTTIYNHGKDLSSLKYEILRNIPLFASIVETVDTNNLKSLWNGLVWYAVLTPLVYAQNRVRHLKL
ncbi:MAG: hypothetical protein Q8R37_01975 [Nanoarchaeota archaeon]|nr:hypothetical protein [Nanoarchaeota archaeon]